MTRCPDDPIPFVCGSLSLYYFLPDGDNSCLDKEILSSMPATGELIRMMNFVDDIAATLRRIHVGITGMTVEERKRLSDYLRNMDPSFTKILEALDKA